MNKTKSCYYCQSTQRVVLVLDSMIPGSRIYACQECRTTLAEQKSRDLELELESLKSLRRSSGFLNQWLVPHMLD